MPSLMNVLRGNLGTNDFTLNPARTRLTTIINDAGNGLTAEQRNILRLIVDNPNILRGFADDGPINIDTFETLAAEHGDEDELETNDIYNYVARFHGTGSPYGVVTLPPAPVVGGASGTGNRMLISALNIPFSGGTLNLTDLRGGLETVIRNINASGGAGDTPENRTRRDTLAALLRYFSVISTPSPGSSSTADNRIVEADFLAAIRRANPALAPGEPLRVAHLGAYLQTAGMQSMISKAQNAYYGRVSSESNTMIPISGQIPTSPELECRILTVPEGAEAPPALRHLSGARVGVILTRDNHIHIFSLPDPISNIPDLTAGGTTTEPSSVNGHHLFPTGVEYTFWASGFSSIGGENRRPGTIGSENSTYEFDTALRHIASRRNQELNFQSHAQLIDYVMANITTLFNSNNPSCFINPANGLLRIPAGFRIDGLGQPDVPRPGLPTTHIAQVPNTGYRTYYRFLTGPRMLSLLPSPASEHGFTPVGTNIEQHYRDVLRGLGRTAP